MVKEATSILKGVTRLQPSGSHDNRTRCRLSPYLVQCYSCYGWGHIGRNCKTGRAVCNLGTTFSINFHVSFAFVVLVLIFSLPLGWVIFTLSVDLGGGPSQCLNFGPGSEPGVNRELGSLFLGYASDLS